MSERDMPSEADVELEYQIQKTTHMNDVEFINHCEELTQDGKGELVPLLQYARLTRQAFAKPVIPRPEAFITGRQRLIDAATAKKQKNENR